MDGTTIAAATIGAVPATLAAALAYLGVRHGRANQQTLATVEAQTNGELDQKIARAVQQFTLEHPEAIAGAVVAEAVRDLLDGILQAAQSEGEPP